MEEERPEREGLRFTTGGTRGHTGTLVTKVARRVMEELGEGLAGEPGVSRRAALPQ
jgi:hypothetical protein